MRSQLPPPVSAESDHCKLPCPSTFTEIAAEFLFRRRSGDALDQQISDQTPRLNYLLSAYPEPVTQAQSLCLYFQKFFERDESLRRIRLILDLPQLLARVSLNCAQVYLHLIAPPGLMACKPGAKGVM